jgi:hypothetical protein
MIFLSLALTHSGSKPAQKVIARRVNVDFPSWMISRKSAARLRFLGTAAKDPCAAGAAVQQPVVPAGGPGEQLPHLHQRHLKSTQDYVVGDCAADPAADDCDVLTCRHGTPDRKEKHFCGCRVFL